MNKVCKLVPPIKEAYLNADKHAEIESMLKTIFVSAYQQTLLTHKFSSAACISGELCVSYNSIHSNSAMFLAKSSMNDSIKPAVSHKYLKLTVILVSQLWHWWRCWCLCFYTSVATGTSRKELVSFSSSRMEKIECFIKYPSKCLCSSVKYYM